MLYRERLQPFLWSSMPEIGVPVTTPDYQHCIKCGHDKLTPQPILSTHLPKDDDGSPDYETTMRLEVYVCENRGFVQLRRSHPADRFQPVYRKQFQRLPTQ